MDLLGLDIVSVNENFVRSRIGSMNPSDHQSNPNTTRTITKWRPSFNFQMHFINKKVTNWTNGNVRQTVTVQNRNSPVVCTQSFFNQVFTNDPAISVRSAVWWVNANIDMQSSRIITHSSCWWQFECAWIKLNSMSNPFGKQCLREPGQETQRDRDTRRDMTSRDTEQAERQEREWKRGWRETEETRTHRQTGTNEFYQELPKTVLHSFTVPCIFIEMHFKKRRVNEGQWSCLSLEANFLRVPHCPLVWAFKDATVLGADDNF